ncbi:MAG: hypothetical protein FJX75_13440 [Armatimonadetes bacterium]|nr:hypothetical protein [Armatimonadota bacterium]
MRANCVIVHGDLQGFTAFSRAEKESVEDFCEAFYRLVARHLHANPTMHKFLGDGFVFLYETPEAGVPRVRNIVESAIVLHQAYVRHVQMPPGEGDFRKLSEPAALPRVLGMGVTRGNVFVFDDPDGRPDFASAYANLAAKLAEQAKSSELPVHLLVDSSVPLFPDVDEWRDATAVAKAEVEGWDERSVWTVSREVAEGLYVAKVEQVAASEARRAFYETCVKVNAIPAVLKLELNKDVSPSEATVWFNPEAFRGMIDRHGSVRLALIAIGSRTVRRFLSVGVPADRASQFSERVPSDMGRSPMVVAVALQSLGGPDLPEFGGLGENETAVPEWLDSLRSVVQHVRQQGRGMAVLFSRY